MTSPDAAHPRWLDRLNAAQREAVLATEGPVLILAGAGTGKTRTLISRLAWILHCGLARPWEVLAVTFTNKAADEMRARARSYMSEGPGGATESGGPGEGARGAGLGGAGGAEGAGSAGGTGGEGSGGPRGEGSGGLRGEGSGGPRGEGSGGLRGERGGGNEVQRGGRGVRNPGMAGASPAPAGLRSGYDWRWVGTFHALSLKMLRTFPEKVGLKSGFIILDADDQTRLVKELAGGDAD